jgi:hypothetical protein
VQQSKSWVLKGFESIFRCVLLIVQIALLSGVCQASYAGGPFFSPRHNTSLTSSKHGHTPFLPVFHIPLRVHLDRSFRPTSDFKEILDEINHIWWSQAGICFEMQIVMNDRVRPLGFDIWFVPHIDSNDSRNGLFDSAHAIYVRDMPILSAAPRPAKHSAARTAAHELGHALNLPHRQDSDDNLMRSKTYGWHLNGQEIAVARKAAAVQAGKNNIASKCSPVQINP